MTRALIAACALVATAAYSHHATAPLFDESKRVEITGTVTEVSWRNPHGFVRLDVTDDNGDVTRWEVETGAISVLRNRGFDIDVIHVGDEVTFAGAPSRRGRPQLWARSALLQNGYEYPLLANSSEFEGRRVGYVAPRELDAASVAAARASADGIFRVWSTNMGDPAAFPMFKGGYPLTATAEAALAEWDPFDNILFRCNTKGTPHIMITPFPVEFVRVGADTIELRMEEYDAVRTIHMNEDAQPPAEHTMFGFSRGRFEGTTLVVETDHIAAGYFDPDGTPQSDQITIVEHFMPNEDFSRLDYRLTVTDPVNFTETFALTRYFEWRPGMRVHPYECLEMR
jgi:hypothetical protein